MSRGKAIANAPRTRREERLEDETRESMGITMISDPSFSDGRYRATKVFQNIAAVVGAVMNEVRFDSDRDHQFRRGIEMSDSREPVVFTHRCRHCGVRYLTRDGLVWHWGLGCEGWHAKLKARTNNGRKKVSVASIVPIHDKHSGVRPVKTAAGGSIGKRRRRSA